MKTVDAKRTSHTVQLAFSLAAFCWLGCWGGTCFRPGDNQHDSQNLGRTDGGGEPEGGVGRDQRPAQDSSPGHDVRVMDAAILVDAAVHADATDAASPDTAWPDAAIGDIVCLPDHLPPHDAARPDVPREDCAVEDGAYADGRVPPGCVKSARYDGGATCHRIDCPRVCGCPGGYHREICEFGATLVTDDEQSCHGAAGCPLLMEIYHSDPQSEFVNSGTICMSTLEPPWGHDPGICRNDMWTTGDGYVDHQVLMEIDRSQISGRKIHDLAGNLLWDQGGIMDWNSCTRSWQSRCYEFNEWNRSAYACYLGEVNHVCSNCPQTIFENEQRCDDQVCWQRLTAYNDTSCDPPVVIVPNTCTCHCSTVPPACTPASMPSRFSPLP